MNEEEQIREAKRLLAQSSSWRSTDAALADLTLTVQILIGLVEGHRHTYGLPIRADGNDLTGPMQAREGQL